MAFRSGASDCHGSSAVSRYYRDAKIMEIIEGTTQIHEDMLGKDFCPASQHQDAVDRLIALRERALSDRREELLADVPTAWMATRVANTWRPTAECIYRNWLLCMRAQKERGLRGEVRSKVERTVNL